MTQERLKINKNWFKNSYTREEVWDVIVDNLIPWALRTQNNLNQLGLDINGADYDFNNDGRKTQTTPLATRLTTLEGVELPIGTRNIALDVSDQTKVAIFAGDGTNFSSTNAGKAIFNSTTSIGQILSRDITANISLTLTGCHWGFTGDGDLTDVPLWVMLIDTGSTTILGVAAQGARETVTAADCETAVGNVNSIEKILTSSAVSATYNVTYLGWVKANYDDTGNAGGENYWTVQNAVGDINIGPAPTFVEGEIRF